MYDFTTRSFIIIRVLIFLVLVTLSIGKEGSIHGLIHGKNHHVKPIIHDDRSHDDSSGTTKQLRVHVRSTQSSTTHTTAVEEVDIEKKQQIPHELLPEQKLEQQQQQHQQHLKRNKSTKKRRLNAFNRLINTPISHWTIEQWLIFLVILWLFGWALRRLRRYSICDILACYCCWEIFCDGGPVGYFLW